MGLNSVLVVLNDHLHNIRDDPDFGRKVHDAVCAFPYEKGRIYQSFAVVAVAHADYEQIVRVGHNAGELLPDDERDAVEKIVRKKRKAQGMGVGR